MIANEEKRLHLLDIYQIMDSGAEQAFDDLTSLAADICDVPACLVSIIGEERQWFKSRHGMQRTETPRDISFCTHAIQQDDIFIVENALQDDRFATNPLVTGEPAIRFYAGVPLAVSEGVNLGTLCVIDYKARALSERQQSALKKLAKAVVALMELRRAQNLLKEVQDLIPMCAWCGNVHAKDANGDQWYPVKKYIEIMGRVSHGICPDCHSKAISPI